MIDYLKIPNNDNHLLGSLILILLFFIINSFVIGYSLRRKMNMVSISACFMIGSMILLITLLVFEAFIGLFGIDYNLQINPQQESSIMTNGFITFLVIQFILIVFYVLNWKAFKINFNINIGKLISFLILFIFLIGMYYGYILKVISPFSMVEGSAFFESIKMITSFSNNYPFGEVLEVDYFLVVNGINIYLLLITAISINSFGHYGFKNFYIIFKKIALALIFLSIFLIMDGTLDFINYLFVFPFLVTLFGFYWNDKEIIVNDSDKANVLILTMISIIIFNYWFLLISLLLAFFFLIFSLKRATNASISEFSRIFIFSLLTISLGFSSFQYPPYPINETIFVAKIFISLIFLILFAISYVAVNLVKKNDKYWNIVYRIGFVLTKKFNRIFWVLIILEYIILISLLITKVIVVIQPGDQIVFLNSFFSFFNVTSLGIDNFSFFLTLWALIILLLVILYIVKRTTPNKHKINNFFGKANLKNLDSNIIFISFIAIGIIFNPLFFPLVNIGLTSSLIHDGYFELTNIDQKISFLNLIWIIPFLITISRINEKGFFVIKNYWYLVTSESIFTTMMVAFPIYKIITR